jgi:hypothetical protein
LFNNVKEREMTSVDLYYKDTFSCNRLPGHSKCAKKFEKNKCPAGHNQCVSRQSGSVTFWPVVFFGGKEKVVAA